MDILRNGWQDAFRDAEAADHDADVDAGFDGSLAGGFAPRAGFDDAEAIFPEAPPPVVGQEDRRMQVRAYNHWAGLLGDRQYPAPAAIDFAAIADIAPRAVLLDFSQGVDDPLIAFLGHELAAECGAPTPTGEAAVSPARFRLRDVPAKSVLSRITGHYLQILTNEAPIGFEAEFINLAGLRVLYRAILLPFSQDDRTITHVMGVINWKELADLDLSDALLRELAPELMTPPSDVPTRSFDAALASAQRQAAIARDGAGNGADRGRNALYAAIGGAWDVACAAGHDPESLARALHDAQIASSSRAPLLPLVKLVFGAGHDKTRLTEYATVLAHARRLDLPANTLPAYLAAAPGGLKAVIAGERRLKRQAAGGVERAGGSLAASLRALPVVPLASLAREGAEFTLLVARRDAQGLAVLGEVAGDAALLRRAARRILPPG